MVNSTRKNFMAAVIVALLSLSSPFTLTSTIRAQQSTDAQMSPLIEQLKSEDIKKRLDAIATLSRNPSSEAIRILIATLKDNNQNPEVRRSAADALSGIGTGAEVAIPALIDVLKDKDNDKELRRTVALAVRRIDAKPAVQALLAALGDEDDGVRRYAIDALGSIGVDAKDAVPKLTELLTQDLNSHVRSSAAEALGNIDPHNTAVVPALNKALTDPAWFVRNGAAKALTMVGPEAKEAVLNLRMALKDRNRTLRTWAAKALGEIGAEALEAVPDLRDALDDENPPVRANAAEALGKIGLDDRNIDENQKTIKKLSQTLEDEDQFVCSQIVAAIKSIAGKLQAKVEAKKFDLNEAISNLDEALKAMENFRSKIKEEDIADVKQHLQFLKAKKTEREIIDGMLKNPWFWGVGIYLVSLGGIFWIRPLWLLKIDEFLQPFSVKVPLLGAEISLRFLVFPKYHPRVLDAWVSAHLKSVREQFQEKDTVRDRNIHIPIPIVLDRRTVAQLTSQELRTSFKKHLLIWGEGGVGKTNLACQIAKWAMSDDKAFRLSSHRMLPVLIEEELNLDVAAGKQPFIAAIQGQLQDLTDEPEPIPEELLQRLLRRRRVLVIVDRFSEMSEATRDEIRPEMPDFAVNALIVTSRIEETLGHVGKTTLKPLRIEGNRLSSFMEAYLMLLGKRDLFTDSEFFDACSRLSQMVGQRNITALLAKLYGEQLIAAKVESIQESPLQLPQLPNNIPDLMLSYLNELNRDVTGDKFDNRTVHQDAKILAWECLKQIYRSAAAKRENALASLGGNKAEARLQYLETRLRPIQTIGPGQDQIHFSLDPLAEYLAGLHLLDIYGKDEQLWRQFLQTVCAIPGAPESIKGFLVAVRDCCLAKGKEAKVPDFVGQELGKLAELPSPPQVQQAQPQIIPVA